MSVTEQSVNLFNLDRVEGIAARLDLRQPNKEALESIVLETVQHYEIDGKQPPFEAVVDSATGAGKTYILAAAIEYFAADGVRNFAVITPGRTILDKTVANFTPNHAKSLLGGMDVRPVVITSENFATAAMRAAMDDSQQVKLFVFNVQSLIKPTTKAGRKTHEFHEGLGEAFYAHLREQEDLVVFADEHHAYYSPAFSSAIRDLDPRVLIGLTATPHKNTPEDQIIYRYPLAAAIADKLVKTPVLVGRRDDRTDIATKLMDGIRLLGIKEQAIEHWRKEIGCEPVNPVMLVIAPNIAEAGEIERIITDPSFAGGRYADKVLTVHSNAADKALEQLEKLEEPDSPYRIVISVGMLKEGWDVKNVYVIASMRASVSDILTEQTLGRGLRLPFGAYTGIEILDTLEVLGHERYEDLLKKAGVLREQFIDRRTRAVLRRNGQGQLVSTTETTSVSAPVGIPAEVEGPAGTVQDPSGAAVITSVEEHTKQAEEALTKLNIELAPRPDLPPLLIPRLKMTPVKSEFSLSDITDLEPFRRLGANIAANPDDTLRRVTVGARVVTGQDGLRSTELVTAEAVDRIDSQAVLFSLPEIRQHLLDVVMNAPIVPARANQRMPAGEIVDAFLAGVGGDAEETLSRYLDRASAGLVRLLTQEHRKFTTKPQYSEVVELISFGPVRNGRPVTSDDRYGAYKKNVGYGGYKKSIYAQDWFDSSPERDVANALEDEAGISLWVRLQTGDLPILWAEGRNYNPDFIAIDKEGTHWLIEVKSDKEMGSDEVQGKREAARRWANHVSADEQVGVRWRYLLASETDIRTARGSWAALKGLGGH